MVVEVNLESSNLLKYRGSYKTSNRYKSTLYIHSFTLNESKFQKTPKKLELHNLKEKTNLSIGVLGRLALVSFDRLLFFLGLSSNYQIIEARSIQPTDFLCIINIYIFINSNLKQDKLQFIHLWFGQNLSCLLVV